MAKITAETWKRIRESSLKATAGGPPQPTSNPFFGVGPITDGVIDEAAGRLMRFEFDHWLETNYRKLDDRGRPHAPFTTAEVGRSMHRGYPADKFLLDMMREIHRYFGFPVTNKMAVGLGGGHSGFTVCALHLINGKDQAQHIFIDTPKPESDTAKAGGFFRQSWGAQITELLRHGSGSEDRLHFTTEEGHIPSSDALERMGIKLFFGVGHETTGATVYSVKDIENLLDWIDRNPSEHHAVLDATSMLGSMPWPASMVREVMTKCCMFTPFQKAIGGISGYFIASFTPQALALAEANQKQPSWAIPRQLKLAAPLDAKKPLTGERSVSIGPFYDPAQDKIIGGVINTFSTLAFAETTFGLQRFARTIGTVEEMNRRSVANRAAVEEWIASNPLFELGVSDAERRGAAVTLLKVKDPDIQDTDIHARLIARTKQLLGYEGLTHSDGAYEKGLDTARYLNAFPGTPGDFRAWIGGVRPIEDVYALLDNIRYAYHRARIVVAEEDLAAKGEAPASSSVSKVKAGSGELDRPHAVLICDLIGLRHDKAGKPDHSEVKRYVEGLGEVFHEGGLKPGMVLTPGRIHFFYVPHLAKADEILAETADGRYDAVIAAATPLPASARFDHGGVRIGAGTGNMGSASWGGGNGEGGTAPLMNTPSFNSRATAQMVVKALLRVLPDLPVDLMHERSLAGDFDTGRDLKDFPTEKLEGKKIAILGYGNIGREVARIAAAFGMRVAIHARPRHRDWIESEGFIFAATPEEAAMGADVLSPHTGLGPLNAATGKHANAGVVSAAVFAAMNDQAVLINYDRGEVVDPAALDQAIASGKIRHAAIDADLFKDPKTGKLSGPLVPYLDIAKKHPGKLHLLPHAAADTEHVSRVEGAKQAVDQIISCIRHKRVINLKGDLPEGYANGGSATVPCVGKVSASNLDKAAADAETVNEARQAAETLAAFWGALSTASDPEKRAKLIERYGAKLVMTSNRYATLMRKLGLEGPYA